MATALAPGPAAIAAYYAALERYWHPVATTESVAGRPVGLELLGRPLVLVRLDGRLCCFEDVCRHMGTALSIGEVIDSGRHLRCAYHGWTYDQTGRWDDTHFPWVHEGILGDRAHPEPPDHQVYRQGSELVSTYTMLQPANASIGGQESGEALESVTYTNHVTPTTIRLVKQGPAGTYVI